MLGTLLLLSLVPTPTLLGEERTLVKTSLGPVQGGTVYSDLGAELHAWNSIPYATPPLGELRFQPPVAMRPWREVRNVTAKPNSCVQISGVQFAGHPGEEVWLYNTPISEDCLYLSVVKPAHKSTTPLPVMVWIYGGSFYSGTYTLDLYDPRILASEQNIIVAAIQYRVASLGFLFLGTEDVPGNMGLLDQVMALSWIKENIRHFGGDPTNITLFSESAGSASVGFHLVSPVSRDLFQRAILQSATALNPWALITKQEAKSRALALAARLDCPTDPHYIKNTISCLRQANATQMVNAEHDKIVFGICSFPFVPIVDGTFLPNHPLRILTSGKFQPREVLLGSNLDEGAYFLIYYLTDIFRLSENISMSPEAFDTAVAEVNMYVKPLGLAAIKFMYTDWMDPGSSRSNARSLDRMTGDFHFTCPVINFAEQLAAADPPVSVYQYHFLHRTENSPWPTWAGVMHGDEIAFVFGDPFRKKGAVNYTEVERRLSREMMTYWANFAKTGDPNRYSNGSWVPSLGGAYWPIHSHTNREYLEIGSLRHKNKTGLRTKECAFWKSYLPQLLKNAEEPMSGGRESGGGSCGNCRCEEEEEVSAPCSCPAHSALLSATLLLALLSTVLTAAVL